MARIGTITIGAQGVASGPGADVVASAGNGSIVGGGGTVSADEVQLRASRGIGADGTPVKYAFQPGGRNFTWITSPWETTWEFVRT